MVKKNGGKIHRLGSSLREMHLYYCWDQKSLTAISLKYEETICLIFSIFQVYRDKLHTTKTTLTLFSLNMLNYKLSTAQEIQLKNNCIHLYNLTVINILLKHTMLIFKEGLSRDVRCVPLRGDFVFCVVARK